MASNQTATSEEISTTQKLLAAALMESAPDEAAYLALRELPSPPNRSSRRTAQAPGLGHAELLLQVQPRRYRLLPLRDRLQ
jgi:hypothetical protein